MSVYHYNLGMLFEERAHGCERAALRFPGLDVTYGDLLDLTARLAAFLTRRGIGRGDVVAIAHNKAALSYALMLAALRIGAPYVNIDTASPLARNSRILSVSGARLLFVDDPDHLSSMEQLGASCGVPVHLLAEDELRPLDTVELERQRETMAMVDGATIAYIMFTSGSTGTPKGVAVTHQNVLHFIQWGIGRFGITAEDNFANLSPMYFDNSVFDFYVALFSGASLTPVHRNLLNAPSALVEHVAAMGCTIWFSVPSLLIYVTAMKALTASSLPSIRHFVFGGEGYPKVELVKLHRMFGRQAKLVNVYGPTECTCICSAYDLTEADFADLSGLPPLGRLNQNFDYRIVDENDEGTNEGELCLIGPNVAAGYFNDAERTQQSFVTISDPKRFMKRMYRTGDLIRRVGDTLFFIGRKDNQIKHMGYRIELEEIEHGLAKLPGVYQAAAIYQRRDAAFGKIFAFVSSGAPLDEKSLLKQLQGFLPEYMIPSRILVVDALPKSPNGKVDRQGLAALLPNLAR
jgi:D-alanine--poly(phosphoribitol) ligase subunit 1